jgi:hypothetical protein
MMEELHDIKQPKLSVNMAPKLQFVCLQLSSRKLQNGFNGISFYSFTLSFSLYVQSGESVGRSSHKFCWLV